MPEMDDDNRSVWDKIKDFAAGGGALKKAASVGGVGKDTSNASPNAVQGGYDPTFMQQQKRNAQEAADAAARSKRMTSVADPTPTPITVQKKGKGKGTPPPNPQDILAAPQKGKK